MAFITSKRIHGKMRHYLERSVRLHDGAVKKYAVYLKDYSAKNKESLQRAAGLLNKKVSTGFLTSASTFYEKSSIFTTDVIQQLEHMKLNYKTLLKTLTSKQYQDIIDRFAVNFTYESNAIEGNSLTLKDVTMLFHENKVPSKNLREIHETLNTRKALEALFYYQIKIKEKDILKLHDILVKETGVLSGYKKFPNYLLGRNVETVAPEYVVKEMEQLISWYHHQKTMHPLQKAAFFHACFEKIHPFEDGNGRVGRILINAILLDHGYPPLIIRKTQRVAYFGALASADRGHYEKVYWFLLEKYKKTWQQFFEVYVKYL